MKSVITISLSILLIWGCKQSEKTYDGESFINYPDIAILLTDNMTPYENAAIKVKMTTIENEKKSEKILSASELNWAEIKTLFLNADFNSEAYNNEYKISIFEDTISHSNTILYTSLDKSNPTKKLSIVAGMDQTIFKSLYIENSSNGFFSSESYKLLYEGGQTIQIQKRIKKAFSKEKNIIQTIKFLYDN